MSTTIAPEARSYVPDEATRRRFAPAVDDDGHVSCPPLDEAALNFLLNTVLEEVNTIRTTMLIGEGKLEEFDPGERKNAHNCVLARALSNGWRASVHRSRIELSHQGDPVDSKAMARQLCHLGFFAQTYSSGMVEISHTWALGRFVQLFDQGWYPELILGD